MMAGQITFRILGPGCPAARLAFVFAGSTVDNPSEQLDEFLSGPQLRLGGRSGASVSRRVLFVAGSRTVGFFIIRLVLQMGDDGGEVADVVAVRLAEVAQRLHFGEGVVVLVVRVRELLGELANLVGEGAALVQQRLQRPHLRGVLAVRRLDALVVLVDIALQSQVLAFQMVRRVGGVGKWLHVCWGLLVAECLAHRRCWSG